MTAIRFARTRHHYPQYDDFWNIVHLAGFPIVYLDEVDWQDAATVIFTPKNGELNIPPDCRARAIWWNLERCHRDEPPTDMAHPFKPDVVDEVWASDRAMAEWSGARYVFLGGVEQAVEFDYRQPRTFDVITLMYWSQRRQAIQHALTSRFKMAPNGWGDERHRAILASRLMVSAHQDEYPWMEPIKFALCAMYGLPILSEVCADSGHWEAGRHYLATNLLDLPTYAEYLLRDDVALSRLAANAWRLVVREHPFRREVEAAVKAQVAV